MSWSIKSVPACSAWHGGALEKNLAPPSGFIGKKIYFGKNIEKIPKIEKGAKKSILGKLILFWVNFAYITPGGGASWQPASSHHPHSATIGVWAFSTSGMHPIILVCPVFICIISLFVLCAFYHLFNRFRMHWTNDKCIGQMMDVLDK